MIFEKCSHQFCRTVSAIALLIAVLCQSAAADAAERPNVLWLSCEDISAHFGCYGDPHAITPTIDALASEGVRYSHAYTAAGVCAPCRSTIITGMYQTTIGTQHMRCNATLPEFIKPFPVYLREAGYYCTNSSKTDYQFKSPKETWDESSGKAHWRNRPDEDQPFFAVFNFTGCHESGIASKEKYELVTKDLKPEQRQDADKLTTLPSYYPDTPVVREDWKRNYELITAMDAWAANLLAELEEDGLSDNTIVIFWSDHGVGLPRAKRWLYESGTHIPMVARIPEPLRVDGQGAPGTVDSQLISSLDFGPTVLNLAGLEIPDHVQGRAFLGSDLSEPREFVYGARDRMDERYDIIRSVRDKQYRYIRNYEPLKPYYQYMNTPEKGATMSELRRVHAEGGLKDSAAELFMAEHKPVEELYDLEADPHEVTNIVNDPAHRGTLERLRVAHQDWVRETRDLGLIPEPEIAERVAIMGSEYSVMRQTGSEALYARLAEVAALASRGESGFSELRQAIDDEDAAVRYWAATGIGNIGKAAEGLAAELKEQLADQAPVVRVAVARALCLIGEPEDALPVLAAELESDQQWTRLYAAIVLDEIDEQARPVEEAIRKGLEDQPNKYIVRVCNKALNDLLGTQNTVQ